MIYIGLDLSSSNDCIVQNGTCMYNTQGIYVDMTESCEICFNTFQNNTRYGVYLTTLAEDISIHHNNFIDNNIVVGSSQGYDDGTGNTWYDTSLFEGNYWSDWVGSGDYSIDGATGSSDLYPLADLV